jgi:hypothetical protein
VPVHRFTPAELGNRLCVLSSEDKKLSLRSLDLAAALAPARPVAVPLPRRRAGGLPFQEYSRV